MRIQRKSVLIFAFSLILFTHSVSAQNRFVQILKFDIDGNQIDQRFKVLFYINKRVIEPLRFDNGFVVPEELRNYDKVDVRFLCGKYDLYFESVYTSKFTTDWIIGINTKSFDKESMDSSPPGKKLVRLYYIQFVSKVGDDTKVTVKVYK